MEIWQLLTLEELEGHDVYELAPAACYDPELSGPEAFWRPEYRYLSDGPEGMDHLAPFLESALGQVAYYGDQRVPLEAWDRVEALALGEGTEDGREAFFTSIRQWLREYNGGAAYFWLLGI